MCIICVELIKHRLTYHEAENASKEMVVTAKDGSDTTHYEELNRSLREADLETLDKLLGEGWDAQSNDRASSAWDGR